MRLAQGKGLWEGIQREGYGHWKPAKNRRDVTANQQRRHFTA